jgi:hypothetical protein
MQAPNSPCIIEPSFCRQEKRSSLSFWATVGLFERSCNRKSSRTYNIHDQGTLYPNAAKLILCIIFRRSASSSRYVQVIAGCQCAELEKHAKDRSCELTFSAACSIYVIPARTITTAVAVAMTHCIHLPGCRYRVLCHSDEPSTT